MLDGIVFYTFLLYHFLHVDYCACGVLQSCLSWLMPDKFTFKCIKLEMHFLYLQIFKCAHELLFYSLALVHFLRRLKANEGNLHYFALIRCRNKMHENLLTALFVCIPFLCMSMCMKVKNTNVAYCMQYITSTNPNF